MRTRNIVITVILAVVLTVVALPMAVKAAPVRQLTVTISQPDSSKLVLLAHGDEWCHWLTDLDGNLMLQDDAGYYRPATAEQEAAWYAETQERMQQLQQANDRRAQRRLQARSRLTERTSIIGGDNETLPPNVQRIRGLVVLVEFKDKPFTIENPLQHYHDMMMKPGFDYSTGRYTHYGSAHDYFYQNSMGQFDPQFDVYGPIILDKEADYYGENGRNGYDVRAYEIVIEACDSLKSRGMDFKPYDNDGDGKIDFVFAIYAGSGENATQVANEIWPHAWSMSSAGHGNRHFYDGVCLEDYACTCELYRQKPDGLGTFCHEFSHVLGLPDVYNTNTNSRATPYTYSVLDNGCYLENGYHPVGYSAYERYQLGWLTPVELSSAATDTLTYIGTSNQAYILPVTEDFDQKRDREYFLFENRQQTGWDKYLPGHGMLVWHIDYNESKWDNNLVNSWLNHQCIRLVEAGQRWGASPDGTAPFPGTDHITEFTDDTTPALSGWAYPGTSDDHLTHRLNKPITRIREVYDDDHDLPIIVFDFMGGDTGIQRIEQDNTTHTGTILLNQRLIISTGNGCYDLMGRKL